MRHHVSLRKYWQNRIPPRKLNLTLYFKITSIFCDRYPTVHIKQSRCVVVGGEGVLLYRTSFQRGIDFWRSKKYFVQRKMCLIIFNFIIISNLKKKNTYNFIPLIKYCACQVINASRSIFFYHSVMTGGKASQ